MRIMPWKSGRGRREASPFGIEVRRGSLRGIPGVGRPERLDHSWNALILASAHTAAVADCYVPEEAPGADNDPQPELRCFRPRLLPFAFRCFQVREAFACRP